MPSLNAPRGFATKAASANTTAIAIGSTVFNFASSDLDAADQVILSTADNDFLLTWDGTTPTTALGHVVKINNLVTIKGNANVKNVKVLQLGATAAVVSATLEKY